MFMTILVGYFLAVVVGISLGVFGAGGSILTVPILVYVVGISPVLATAYSLLVVGATSLVGAVSYIRRGEVNIATAVVFAIPSVVAVYATRRFVVPAIPPKIFSIGTYVVERDALIMLLFGVIMAWAAVGMVRAGRATPPSASDSPAAPGHRPFLIAGEGFLVGGLTGLVGAGGGFLIVPVLVLAAGMAMRQAVGTSLIIITLKSLVGFVGDLGAGQDIDWMFLTAFAAFAMAGILVGGALSTHVSEAKIKPLFGWFVLGAGGLIIVTELLQGGFA
ncbi:MAG TPA: sulfite exporter TauE/SafE family protein [Alkalispirochaeta sp.]|nr:sulfite exporter TauE/SafE family protein [Alkalispirochaeta sp.]